MHLGLVRQEQLELRRDEWIELGEIQFLATMAISRKFELEKEYSCCFSETDGFKHLHFHVIPKTVDTGQDSIGMNAFRHLKPDPESVISSEEIRNTCEDLGRIIEEERKNGET